MKTEYTSQNQQKELPFHLKLMNSLVEKESTIAGLSIIRAADSIQIAEKDIRIAEKSIKQAEQDIKIAENNVKNAQTISLVTQRERELVESGETEKLDEFIRNFHNTYKF